jgi:hypothetical protein
VIVRQRTTPTADEEEEPSTEKPKKLYLKGISEEIQRACRKKDY